MSRQIWMIPRNKRRMPPLETALILRAMVVASELGKTWGGKQDQQDKFTKLLEEYGLKKGGNQRDTKSGGARTYESQMSFLGLIYKDKKGKLNLTQAGEDLVNFNDTAKTFEYQLLKTQYPSAYSISSNVGLDPKIVVRPFIFLLNLAADPEINGISDKDIVVPVVFGKHANCHDQCKQLILKLRSNGKEEVIPDDTTIRTSKTINKSYEERLKDIGDIANTFKNILESSGLADLRIINGQTRLFPRPDALARIPGIEKMPFIDFINLSKEQATLQYGRRYGAIKDTRRVLMPSKAPELKSGSGLIFQRFLNEVCLPVDQYEINRFALKMSKEFLVSKNQVLQALQPILSNRDQYTGSRLIEVSQGGSKTAEAFEKTVAKIFHLEFGYETKWTGRTYRAGPGGHMDVFVVDVGKGQCGVIDTKSMYSYDLPHDDCAKAVSTYIDAVKELYGNRRLDLKFVAYVSHMIVSGARIRAQDIYDRKKVPVSLISAYGLNSMREDPAFRKNTTAVTNRLCRDHVNLIV